LTPGTVCIVLAGRYRGKRVVMLKQINDTILITGPFKINGVPLRRVNPAYVIATSTKIDLSSASLSLDKFDEAYFKVKKEKKGKSTEEEFFGEGEKVFPLLPILLERADLCCRKRSFLSRGHRIRKRSIKSSFPSLQRPLICEPISHPRFLYLREISLIS
jgi:ribosomal protein L14E/L6E/L27E